MSSLLPPPMERRGRHRAPARSKSGECCGTVLAGIEVPRHKQFPDNGSVSSHQPVTLNASPNADGQELDGRVATRVAARTWRSKQVSFPIFLECCRQPSFIPFSRRAPVMQQDLRWEPVEVSFGVGVPARTLIVDVTACVCLLRRSWFNGRDATVGSGCQGDNSHLLDTPLWMASVTSPWSQRAVDGS